MRGSRLLGAAALLLSPFIQAQDVQCVTVPALHKIVFVPFNIPTDELIYKWNKAKEPPPETKETDECDGGLVISPSVCDK